jgi:hypothetical protein
VALKHIKGLEARVFRFLKILLSTWEVIQGPEFITEYFPFETPDEFCKKGRFFLVLTFFLTFLLLSGNPSGDLDDHFTTVFVIFTPLLITSFFHGVRRFLETRVFSIFGDARLEIFISVFKKGDFFVLEGGVLEFFFGWILGTVPGWHSLRLKKKGPWHN